MFCQFEKSTRCLLGESCFFSLFFSRFSSLKKNKMTTTDWLYNLRRQANIISPEPNNQLDDWKALFQSPHLHEVLDQLQLQLGQQWFTHKITFGPISGQQQWWQCIHWPIWVIYYAAQNVFFFFIFRDNVQFIKTRWLSQWSNTVRVTTQYFFHLNSSQGEIHVHGYLILAFSIFFWTFYLQWDWPQMPFQQWWHQPVSGFHVWIHPLYSEPKLWMPFSGTKGKDALDTLGDPGPI